MARALGPFPSPVRTLETLHLASSDFLRMHGQTIALVSYDEGLLATARRLDIEIYAL